MTEAAATKQARVITLHASLKCCLSIFTKIKLLIVNRDSSMVFSVVVLLLPYYFCLRNIFWCIKSKNSLGWEFVYFATCFVGMWQNVLLSSSFYTTVVSDGLHEPYLLLTNSSFILILSDSYRGCLIWVKFVEIPKQKFESQLNVINSFSILWLRTLFQPIRARVIWKLYYNSCYLLLPKTIASKSLEHIFLSCSNHVDDK